MYRHVRDYVLYRDSKIPGERHKAEEALEWINGAIPGYREVDRAGKPIGPIIQKPFMSFESVCEILDQDPDILREKIFKLTKKALFHRLEACAKEEEASGEDESDDGDD